MPTEVSAEQEHAAKANSWLKSYQLLTTNYLTLHTFDTNLMDLCKAESDKGVTKEAIKTAGLTTGISLYDLQYWRSVDYMCFLVPLS